MKTCHSPNLTTKYFYQLPFQYIWQTTTFLIEMKLSTALILLTLGAAEARAGTRRARRRAEDAAADVAAIADSDLVEADSGNGGGMSGCDEDEVGGIVTINYTSGSIDYTGLNGLSTVYNGGTVTGINTGIKNGISSPYPTGTGGTGYGGIAFEYNSDTESVKFKSANGSTFDEDACQEYEKICYNGFERKLDEDGDVVSEDRRGRNDCEGKDTVLFCPMSEGQSATFEVTDTMRYCDGIRKLQDDEEEEVTEDMRPRLAKAGIKFYITTPDNSCPNHVSSISQVTSVTQVTKFAQPSSCYGEDVVAILQCGPTRSRFISQTSDCLYANDCLVNNTVSIGPTNGLGIEHAINLEQCVIRRKRTGKGAKKANVAVGGGGRHLAVVEARNIINAIFGDLNGSFFDFFEKDNIIPKDAVDTLRKMSERKYSVDEFDPKAPHHQQEFRIGSNLTPERLAFYELSGEKLIDAIGKDSSKAILDFVHESFGATASVSKISLQHANMEQQMFISPHMDGKDTALVFLGGSDANVVYLNEKEGSAEAQTYPGKALAHGAYTVHSEYHQRRSL